MNYFKMATSGGSAGAVAKLFGYILVFMATSCQVSSINYGDYHSTNQQRIKLLQDSTFTYITPGPTGESGILTGTWTRAENKLLLHAQHSETRKLMPSVSIKETNAAAARVVIAPEIGINVKVEVLANGAKVGEIGRDDSTFVYEGSLSQLALKAYATGLYADLFRNDTLYAAAIDFSDYKTPVQATVNFQVALRDFHKVPVEDSFIKIKSKQKLFWERKNTLFYWEE